MRSASASASWCYDLARALGLEICEVTPLDGGVVAETMLCQCRATYPPRDSELSRSWVLRRSPMPEPSATSLAALLNENDTIGTVGPSELCASVQPTSQGDWLLTAYRYVDGVAGSRALPGPIGVRLGTLHRDRPLVVRPSVYATIESEAEWSLQCELPVSVRGAAQRILARPTGELDAVRSPRGHLTHGDPKLANAVLTSDRDAVLIDWDKACSVSPELDLVLAMFSFGRLPDIKQLCRQFLDGYVLASGDPPIESTTLRSALEMVADLFTLHDWVVATRSGSPIRSAYWKSQVEPLAGRWTSELRDVASDTLSTMGLA